MGSVGSHPIFVSDANVDSILNERAFTLSTFKKSIHLPSMLSWTSNTSDSTCNGAANGYTNVTESLSCIQRSTQPLQILLGLLSMLCWYKGTIIFFIYLNHR